MSSARRVTWASCHPHGGRPGTRFASYDPRGRPYLVRARVRTCGIARRFPFRLETDSGNFILSTRARFIARGRGGPSEDRLDDRPSLDPGSAHVTAALHGNGLMVPPVPSPDWRTTEEIKSADSLPMRTRSPARAARWRVHVGRAIPATRRHAATHHVSLPDTVYVGLFVCAHNDTVMERATFQPRTHHDTGAAGTALPVAATNVCPEEGSMPPRSASLHSLFTPACCSFRRRPLQRALEALRIFACPLSGCRSCWSTRPVRGGMVLLARDCHWSPRISRRSVTVARREPAQSLSVAVPDFICARNSP